MPDNSAGELDRDGDAPILDLEVCRSITAMLGQQRMVRMTEEFLMDAERRLAALDQEGVTPADVQEHAHSLISMAGHLGFLRLSALSRAVQERARGGGGLDDRPALRAAVIEASKAVQGAAPGYAGVE